MSLQSHFTIFSSAQKDTLYPLVITPQPTGLLFLSIDLLILDISYKWNHKYVGFFVAFYLFIFLVTF